MIVFCAVRVTVAVVAAVPIFKLPDSAISSPLFTGTVPVTSVEPVLPPSVVRTNPFSTTPLVRLIVAPVKLLPLLVASTVALAVRLT